jgi:hypothetical protein
MQRGRGGYYDSLRKDISHSQASEYERHGTATIFMCAEPLRGVRLVRVRAHKTAVDWAMEVQSTHKFSADKV